MSENIAYGIARKRRIGARRPEAATADRAAYRAMRVTLQ
jgi:hypothetical protein